MSSSTAEPLAAALKDPARPSFLFGCTPPREGTDDDKAREACAKFTARSSALATDGFIVYDIQDESSRTPLERPFPFRKTMDPAKYASLFPGLCGKQCVVYKCVAEDSETEFCEWLSRAKNEYAHCAFNLVGAASTDPSPKPDRLSLSGAGRIIANEANCAFGCVCIPERHTSKGNEDANMLKKIKFGCEWFITQGIFASEPIIKLIHDYADLCRKEGLTPKKIILTFAPCGREKTLQFIKWLGMNVPAEVESRLFSATRASVAASTTIADQASMHQAIVRESQVLHAELLSRILQQTAGSGVPLGVNVESLSIFKEEIEAAHTLFQSLQTLMLNGRGSPWSVRWIDVNLHMSRIASKSDNFASTPSTSLISNGASDQNSIKAENKGLLVFLYFMVASLFTKAILNPQ